MRKEVCVSEIIERREFIYKCDADVVSAEMQYNGLNAGYVANLPAGTGVFLRSKILEENGWSEKDGYFGIKEVTCRCSVRREVERAAKRYLREQGYTKIEYIEECCYIDVFVSVDSKQYHIYVNYVGSAGGKSVEYNISGIEGEKLPFMVENIDIKNRNELLTHAVTLAKHYACRNYLATERRQ